MCVCVGSCANNYYELELILDEHTQEALNGARVMYALNTTQSLACYDYILIVRERARQSVNHIDSCCVTLETNTRA